MTVDEFLSVLQIAERVGITAKQAYAIATRRGLIGGDAGTPAPTGASHATLTAALLGDPPPGRSALDTRGGSA